MSKRQERGAERRRQQKGNEVYTLVGLGLTFASWGYSVIAPEPNVYLGSGLLAAAFVLVGIGVCRVFELRGFGTAVVIVAMLSVFAVFDGYVLIAPQRGRQFKELLVDGYHLTDECGSRTASEPLPAWLHDKSTGWQTRVEQLIAQKLDYKNLQKWRGAAVVGLVSDSNLSAYRCTVLAVKVEALEDIISENYDPKLKHQPYEGPLYWFESLDGKVDISEALKHGAARFTIHKGGGGDAKITGKLPPNETPKQQ